MRQKFIGFVMLLLVPVVWLGFVLFQLSGVSAPTDPVPAAFGLYANVVAAFVGTVTVLASIVLTAASFFTAMNRRYDRMFLVALTFMNVFSAPALVIGGLPWLSGEIFTGVLCAWTLASWIGIGVGLMKSDRSDRADRSDRKPQRIHPLY
jgi:hypothetical protein